MAAAKTRIEYPKNVTAQGTLAFPIKSEAEIEKLVEWRTTKGIKKPKFPDKIGGNLFIKEKTLERVASYLENEYLPFVDTLYKETDGAKGIEPEEVANLLKLVKARDWSEKNLPIRELTPKDIENNGGDDCPFVAKIKFSGPYKKDLGVKFIVLDDWSKKQVVVKQNELQDYTNSEGETIELPEGTGDTEALWWGAGWPFRISMRMNAYNQNGEGVTAYVQDIYLLAWQELPSFSSNNDADVVEDGDDWSDE